MTKKSLVVEGLFDGPSLEIPSSPDGEQPKFLTPDQHSDQLKKAKASKNPLVVEGLFDAPDAGPASNKDSLVVDGLFDDPKQVHANIFDVATQKIRDAQNKIRAKFEADAAQKDAEFKAKQAPENISSDRFKAEAPKPQTMQEKAQYDAVLQQKQAQEKAIQEQVTASTPGAVKLPSGRYGVPMQGDTGLPEDVQQKPMVIPGEPSKFQKTVEDFAAGVTSGAIGISKSVYQTPETVKRGVQYLEGLTKSIGSELPPVLKSIGTAAKTVAEGVDLTGNKRIPGFNDLADITESTMRLLPELYPAFERNEKLQKKADVAFNEAVKKQNFTPLLDVILDPEAWAGFIGQAVPSLAVAALSGGHIGVTGWLEGLESAGNAIDFEKKTGIKLTPEQFTKAVSQAAVINGILEKTGVDEILKPFKAGTAALLKSILIGGATEGVTEGLQALNSNLAAKLNYDEKKSLLEGILPSALGGFGAGASAVALSPAMSREEKGDKKSGFNPKEPVGGAPAGTEIDGSQEAFSQIGKEYGLTYKGFTPGFKRANGEETEGLVQFTIDEGPAKGDTIAFKPSQLTEEAIIEKIASREAAFKKEQAPEPAPTPAPEPSAEPVNPEPKQEPEPVKKKRVIKKSKYVLDKETEGLIVEVFGEPEISPLVTILDYMASEIRAGSAGSRHRGGYTPSSYPEYFQNKGYSGENALAVIEKAIAGEELTEKQESMLTDLITSKIAQEAYELRQWQEIENEKQAEDRKSKENDQDTSGSEKSDQEKTGQLDNPEDLFGGEKSSRKAEFGEARYLPEQKGPTDLEKLKGENDQGKLFEKPEGYLTQTKTPQFKAWFGDSKVVDENGEPLVVYHGTDKSFTVFDTKATSQFGAHFTANKEMANEFTGAENGIVVPAYLSLKNPYDMVSDLGDWTDIEMLREFFGPANDGPFTGKEVKAFKTPEDFRGGLIKKGYDGLTYENSFEGNRRSGQDQTVYIAFAPEQIKSAIGNSGAFDPNNPNFLKEQKQQYLFSEEEIAFDQKTGGSDAAINQVIKEIEEKFSDYNVKRAGVVADLRVAKHVNFTGRKVNGPEDIAQLFQVFRSPAVENFHWIVVDKNGVIYSHHAVTCGKLAEVSIDIPGISAMLKQDLAGAGNGAQYYLMHNHPSGKITPSPEDIRMTQRMRAMQRGFAGHIVIDHGEFSLIDSEDGVSNHDYRESGDRFAWAKEDLAPPATGPEALAGFFDYALRGARHLHIPFLDTANRIIAYETFNPFKLGAKLGREIQQRIEKYAARSYIILGDEASLKSLIAKSIALPAKALDVIRVNADGTATSARQDQGHEMSDYTQINDATVLFDPKALYFKSPFYSQVERTIEEKMPNTAIPEHALAMIRNTPGVKLEELDWLGLEEFLKGKEKVTKQELLDFVRQNRVEIHEVTKSEKEPAQKDTEKILIEAHRIAREWGEDWTDLGPNGRQRFIDMANDKFKSTKFSKYTLPGGENYREVLLTIPNAKMSGKNRFSVKAITSGQFIVEDEGGNEHGFVYTNREEAQLSADHRNQEPYAFRSSHFDEPNVIVHMRLNDRQTEKGKTLFIEEIQSDWHQKGRQKGYKGEAKQENFMSWGKRRGMTERQIEDSWNDYQNENFMAWKREQAEALDDSEKVPSAPFKKTWHELALKKVLRMAVEEGYDAIAWTTGEQQNDRYDLSKQIDFIKYGLDGAGKYYFSAIQHGEEVTGKQSLDAKELESYLGKDIAKKIIEDKELKPANPPRSLHGVDLKVGGEGMKGFYDQIVPAFLNKYTKKWGGRATETSILTGDPRAQDRYDDGDINEPKLKSELAKREKVHALEITSWMKDSIAGGQALFETPEKYNPTSAPILGKTVSSQNMPMRLDQPAGAKKTAPTDVMDELEKTLQAFGGMTPIRVGRISQRKALGIFKVRPEVIRLLTANDIPTAAHEVGHAVEKHVYGWPKGGPWKSPLADKKMQAELMALGKALYGPTVPAGGYKREGFAEFVRLYITNEAEAKKAAPVFYQFFTKSFLPGNPEGQKAFKRAQEKAKDYSEQGAILRAKASVVDSSSAKEKFRSFVAGTKRFFSVKQHFEMFQPLYLLQKEAERRMGRKLFLEENPYETAKALRLTHDARAEFMVESGMIDIASNIVGPPLKDITPLVKNRESDFVIYLWAKRALALLNDPKGARNPGLSMADAEHIIKTLDSPEFQLAASKYYDWNDGVLNYVAQASPTMADIVKKIRARDPGYYAPLAREFRDLDNVLARTKGSGAAASASITKALRGSGRSIKNIFPQTIANARNMVKAAHNRIIIDQVIRLARNVEGLGHLVEEVPKSKVPVYSATIEDLISRINTELKHSGEEPIELDPNVVDEVVTFFMPETRPKGKDPIFPVVVNGETKFYEMNGELFDVLRGMDVARLPLIAGMPILENIIGGSKRLFVTGTTGMNPAFSLVTNALIDPQAFALNSSTGNPFKLWGAWVRSVFGQAFKATTGQQIDPYGEAFERLGAKMAQPLGFDVPHTHRASRRLFQGRVAKILDPRNIYDGIRDILSFTEAAPRIAELKLTADRIGWKPGQPMSFEQSIEMLLAAKQVTTDFGAAGEFARIMNTAMPFYNVAFQGPRAGVRAYRKNPKRFMLAGLFYITIPTLLLWWKNKDEDWYKEMDERMKYMFWNIPMNHPEKTLIQIPRHRDFGFFFAGLPESILNQWYKQDPDAVKEWFDVLQKSNNPLNLPPLMQEYAEQIANKDFFSDRPIIPMGMDRRAPAEQYDEHTTKLAIGLAKIFPSWSPKRIDHAVQGVFGTVGRDLTALSGRGSDEIKRETELADTFVAGRLFQRGGQFGRNPRSVDRLYDLKTKMEQTQASIREPETDDQRKRRLVVQNGTKAVSAISFIRSQTQSKEKRFELTKLQIEIARDALAAARADEVDLGAVASIYSRRKGYEAESKQLKLEQKERLRKL